MSRRQANFLGFAACSAMMGYALFVQYVQHIAPCNMCMLQRASLIGLGAVFLLAALHNPGRTGARVYAALIGLGALKLALLAGRHVWVQMQPEGSLPSCGADFWTMLDMMPVIEAVTRILKGGAECQAITWSFLGLSMAAWVLISAVIVGVCGIVANVRLARPTAA
jgi:protein dithiol:quinone oxidoreductase